ncbi:MAG TPA: 2-dehydro-3-deoxygalactonokinase [Terriglobia bacterium]|nr:2-dehydro-3-deoxygalactonokinase [Terriglobia bacterium]
MLYFAVDSGTTNSRVWLMRDREVLAKKRAPVGVRNTAIDGNNRALVEGIREAILELTRESNTLERPQFVIAAGMITSSLGLHEVKHVQAPAGLLELASNVQERHFEELNGIPFHFIPGVRSGPGGANLDNIDSIDIMRGEETEVIGALEEIERIQDGPLLYIHLGSHTKMIQLDASRRISASASTLAGELTQSIVEQTILRSSLPEIPFTTFNPTFFSQGWEHCQRVGFTRALYEVRILQLNSEFSKKDLASFMLGAILFEEFRCLVALTCDATRQQVLLSGLPHLQPAWTFALESHGFSVRQLNAEETERCFLTGMFRIFEQRPTRPA